MDQGLKDQNSEMRDFSPTYKGDDHDNVNLMDMEDQPQIEDEIHSSADFLAGAFIFHWLLTKQTLKLRRKLLGQPKSAHSIHMQCG